MKCGDVMTYIPEHFRHSHIVCHYPHQEVIADTYDRELNGAMLKALFDLADRGLVIAKLRRDETGEIAVVDLKPKGST